jgi:uncharacterized membrane protein (UPF0127 family)
VDVARGVVIAPRVGRAQGWWQRLKGLIGRRNLEPGEGLWIDPCNGIHTFGMRFPIDLLVLDTGGRVLRILTGVRPGRVSPPVRGGRSVVELAAGTLERTGLSSGDRIRWERA